MGTPQRPLSPHLGIYRWQLTMALSILHRATGVFLSLGAIVMVIVLFSIASSADAFHMVQSWLASPLGMIFLVAWTGSLYLHLANGVRHLVWDTGAGLGKAIANQSGLWVIAFTVIATIITWVLVWGIL